MRHKAVFTGHATDIHGQKVDGLVVFTPRVEEFLAEGLVTDYNLTNMVCHLRFLGVSITSEGKEQYVAEPKLPKRDDTIDMLFGQMHDEPSWLQSTSVSRSPLFYYSEPSELVWLEGYGEQQRVAIARAISMESHLLLADEPTGNLDTENSGIIINLLLDLAHKDGYCVIVVTHDTEIAAKADFVYRMNDGLLTQE